MTHHKEQIELPQISMSGPEAVACSLDVARYHGIPHCKLARAIERCIDQDAEWEDHIQEERLNRSARLFTSYRLTATAVHEVITAVGGDDLASRRMEYTAFMDAASELAWL